MAIAYWLWYPSSNVKMTTLLTFEGPFGTIPGFSIVCCDSDNGGGSGCCDIDGVIPDGSCILDAL